MPSNQETIEDPAAALNVGPPPGDEADPESRAKFFLDMLEAFAQHGTQEVKRVRAAILEALDDYANADRSSDEGKQSAMGRLTAALAGIETGVSELLLRSTKKIRDRLSKDSRSLGTGSPVGKAVREAADSMNLMVEGLQKMLKGVQEGSDKLRAEATELMEKARKSLEGLNLS